MDQKAAILNDPGMRSIYINPDTNDTWKEGDTYTRLNFANTLERIAKLGSEASPCSTNLILSKFIQNIIQLYLEELKGCPKTRWSQNLQFRPPRNPCCCFACLLLGLCV